MPNAVDVKQQGKEEELSEYIGRIEKTFLETDSMIINAGIDRHRIFECVDIKKAEFMRFRKLIDYHSLFDNDYQSMIDFREKSIKDWIESISDNSIIDYSELDELMILFWVSEQWKEGVSACDRIMNCLYNQETDDEIMEFLPE